MTSRLLVSSLLLLLPSAAALAQTPAAPQPCLRQNNIWSFDPVPGNRALVVTDRLHRRYRVNFMGFCPNLQFHLGLGFKTRGTSSLACIEKGDSVIVRDPSSPPECIIQSVVPQTAALDKADAAAKQH